MKRYVVNGNRFYYPTARGPERPSRTRSRSSISSRTRRRAGSDADAAGTVRVSSDSNGGVHSSARSHPAHAERRGAEPENRGNAFDVVCERNQIDFENIAANVYEIEYALRCANRKTTPITVEVNRAGGRRNVAQLHASHNGPRRPAFAAQFWCRSMQWQNCAENSGFA